MCTIASSRLESGRGNARHESEASGPSFRSASARLQVRHALGAHIGHSEKVLLGEGAGLAYRRDSGKAQGGQCAGSEDEDVERDFRTVVRPHPPRQPLSGSVRHFGTLEPTHVTKVVRLGSAL